MKKGLKFTKEQLEELYLKQKLSLIQIGKKFNCESTNILYWLKKFDIKRRPAYLRKVDIPRNILYDLYINKRLSSLQIAEKLGVVTDKTIRKKLKKLGIQTRSLSEANTKKFKADFSENPNEKAYLLGLRTGDFYARQKDLGIRVQTTTTHTAQVDLLKNAFSKYGEICKYYSRNKAREDEWFIYTDLNLSFTFLLKKPEEIPSWILGDTDNFYHFLIAYTDCEGTFNVIKSHKTAVRFIFRIKTGDAKILNQIRSKLESMNYTVQLYLDVPKGTERGFGKCNNNIYEIVLYRKQDIIKLIHHLLPLSKHSEKIRKMNFILKNKDKKWNEIEKGWNRLREEIKGELLKNR